MVAHPLQQTTRTTSANVKLRVLASRNLLVIMALSLHQIQFQLCFRIQPFLRLQFAAAAAPPPSYTNVFVNLQGSTQQTSYLGLHTLHR